MHNRQAFVLGRFHFTILLFALALAVTRLPAADEVDQESHFTTNARQLIFEGRRSGEGYFSPDSGKLIFQSEREQGNPFYQIYVLDLNTGDTTRVSPGIGKTTCGFFQPRTDQVLFASTHADPQVVVK
jgi:Tol biopolymer transport system component